MEKENLFNFKIGSNDDLTYQELLSQEYGENDCKISAGKVFGKNKPDCDTVYLAFAKNGKEDLKILLRPDELQAVAWVATGVNWSILMEKEFGTK